MDNNKLYDILYFNFLKLLKEKEFSKISPEDICKVSNIDIELFNSNFKDMNDFFVKEMNYLYLNNFNYLDDIKDFKEYVKEYAIIQLNTFDKFRNEFKTKTIGDDLESNFYFVCFESCLLFLKDKYQSRKNPKIPQDQEEFYIYRLASRVIALVVYFYNNKNVTKEEMLPRLDQSLAVGDY